MKFFRVNEIKTSLFDVLKCKYHQEARGWYWSHDEQFLAWTSFCKDQLSHRVGNKGKSNQSLFGYFPFTKKPTKQKNEQTCMFDWSWPSDFGENSSRYFQYIVIISPWVMLVPFIEANLNIFKLMNLCVCLFGWNWLSTFLVRRWKCEKIFETDRQTDRQTDINFPWFCKI